MKRLKLVSSFFLTIFFLQHGNGQPDSLIVPLKDSLTNKFGYVNKKDSSIFIIKPSFDNAFLFHNNYARVSTGKLIGLINKKGKFLIKPKFKILTTIHKNILIANYNDSTYSVINIYGESIVQLDYFSFFTDKEILLRQPFYWYKEILNSVNDTTITDGQLIARVLYMYSNHKIRLREMINLSIAFDSFAVLILNHIHEILEKLYGKEKLKYYKSKQFKQN